MPETSVADAKAHLTRLIADAERGEVVHITRRGKPVAVLLSQAKYARLSDVRPRASFGALIAEMRADPGFASVDWTRDEVDSWRDRRASRDCERLD